MSDEWYGFTTPVPLGETMAVVRCRQGLPQASLGVAKAIEPSRSDPGSTAGRRILRRHAHQQRRFAGLPRNRRRPPITSVLQETRTCKKRDTNSRLFYGRPLSVAWLPTRISLSNLHAESQKSVMFRPLGALTTGLGASSGLAGGGSRSWMSSARAAPGGRERGLQARRSA